MNVKKYVNVKLIAYLAAQLIYSAQLDIAALALL